MGNTLRDSIITTTSHPSGTGFVVSSSKKMLDTLPKLEKIKSGKGGTTVVSSLGQGSYKLSTSTSGKASTKAVTDMLSTSANIDTKGKNVANFTTAANIDTKGKNGAYFATAANIDTKGKNSGDFSVEVADSKTTASKSATITRDKISGQQYTKAEGTTTTYLGEEDGIPVYETETFSISPETESTVIGGGTVTSLVTTSQSDISITYNELEENINTIKKTVEKLKSSWQGETKKDLTKIESSWIGNDCKEYVTKLNNMDQKVNNVISALELLASTYEKAKSMVQQSQSNAVARIQDIN